ncbi:MAG: hypothetical protein PWR29_1165, partial [Methanolobus sp.]|nr:hypothetical protein [Methanolobus sp.]
QSCVFHKILIELYRIITYPLNVAEIHFF